MVRIEQQPGRSETACARHTPPAGSSNSRARLVRAVMRGRRVDPADRSSFEKNTIDNDGCFGRWDTRDQICKLSGTRDNVHTSNADAEEMDPMYALVRLGLLSALFTALSGLADAQPSAAQQSAIRQSCRSDYQTHCANVPRGGQASLNCLREHATQLSPPCQQALGGGSGNGPDGQAGQPNQRRQHRPFRRTALCPPCRGCHRVRKS